MHLYAIFSGLAVLALLYLPSLVSNLLELAYIWSIILAIQFPIWVFVPFEGSLRKAEWEIELWSRRRKLYAFPHGGTKQGMSAGAKAVVFFLHFIAEGWLLGIQLCVAAQWDDPDTEGLSSASGRQSLYQAPLLQSLSLYPHSHTD